MKTIILEKLNKKLEKLNHKFASDREFLSLRLHSEYNWRAISTDRQTLYVGTAPLTVLCKPGRDLNFKKIPVKDGIMLNKLVNEMRLKIDVTIFLDERFEPPIKEIIIIS